MAAVSVDIMEMRCLVNTNQSWTPRSPTRSSGSVCVAWAATEATVAWACCWHSRECAVSPLRIETGSLFRVSAVTVAPLLLDALDVVHNRVYVSGLKANFGHGREAAHYLAQWLPNS